MTRTALGWASVPQYTPSRSGRAVAKGGAVSGPFIFIATNRRDGSYRPRR
jgi:hypothetical protein